MRAQRLEGCGAGGGDGVANAIFLLCIRAWGRLAPLNPPLRRFRPGSEWNRTIRMTMVQNFRPMVQIFIRRATANGYPPGKASAGVAKKKNSAASASTMDGPAAVSNRSDRDSPPSTPAAAAIPASAAICSGVFKAPQDDTVRRLRRLHYSLCYNAKRNDDLEGCPNSDRRIGPFLLLCHPPRIR